LGSFGRIRLNVVFSMLDECAPGHGRTEGDHYWKITYGEEVFPRFPLGEHGRRANPDIEIGHIKKMCRALGILDCAKAQIEQLR